ncbi:hypothetical protein [Microcystis phage LMM01]|uniref:Uncharacterized protein n=1 Tax=Microcystis phage LMM01 TaxID=2856824 RepID=A0A7C5_9CAUD|nr:hypothetical protein MaLMM01_gp011 [Microcystis phage LMM01]BAF36102.1 hypothetical protein [Microcystis phage LMM01]
MKGVFLMIDDKPHWYTTEYLNRFNVQLHNTSGPKTGATWKN